MLLDDKKQGMGSLQQLITSLNIHQMNHHICFKICEHKLTKTSNLCNMSRYFHVVATLIVNVCCLLCIIICRDSVP
jgi:hypothetical protein